MSATRVRSRSFRQALVVVLAITFSLQAWQVTRAEGYQLVAEDKIR